MKALVIFAICLAATGCSTEDAANQAFAAFRLPCDRHSFTVETKQIADTSTFTATCKRKP